MFSSYRVIQYYIKLKMQGVPKRFINKVNIPYYNMYTSFWDTLYIKLKKDRRLLSSGL
jgi:hypothetical protein